MKLILAPWLLALLASLPSYAQSPAVVGETSLYIDRGQYSDAHRALERGLSQQPNQPTYLTLQGLIFIKTGEYAKAEVSLQRALDNSPANPMSHFNLGEILYLRGKYKESLAAYQTVVKDAEFKPYAQYKEVLALLLTQKLDEAVKVAQSIPQTEKEPAFYYAAAAVEFARGRRDRALYFVDTARRLYAENASVFLTPLVAQGWME
jgi:tetratricopeptide (TPR) repeat protein